MGYHRAGFDVVGVDINPQPHYPFEFIQADCLNVHRLRLDALVRRDPRIPAVPGIHPQGRQLGTRAQALHRAPDLLGPTRAMLEASGLPYVIENVMGAPMRCDVMLCGTMFGLRIIKHRQFETNFPLDCLLPPATTRTFTTPGRARAAVPGSTARRRVRRGFRSVAGRPGKLATRATSITRSRLPYTQWIGEQLIAHIQSEKREAA
jgi:DNA (cytosine-5)-methyltransferase 1